MTRRRTRPTGWRSRKHPHVVDQPYLVSWNNKQAPDWAAADDQYGYGPIYRQQMIADRIRAASATARKMTLPAARAGDGGAGDRRTSAAWSCCRSSSRPSATREAQAARRIATLAAGGRRAPTGATSNKDGVDEFTPAITLMDAWCPKLLAAEFRPTLGKKLFEQTQGMTRLRRPRWQRRQASTPRSRDGWYGYVSKDLRDIYGPKPPAPTAATTAAAARRRSAARRSARSLLAAAKVTPQQEYGFGDCSSDPNPACWDENRATHTSGDLDPGDDLPEPADVPADRVGDARRQVARRREAGRPATRPGPGSPSGQRWRSRPSTTSRSRRATRSRREARADRGQLPLTLAVGGGLVAGGLIAANAHAFELPGGSAWPVVGRADHRLGRVRAAGLGGGDARALLHEDATR